MKIATTSAAIAPSTPQFISLPLSRLRSTAITPVIPNRLSINGADTARANRWASSGTRLSAVFDQVENNDLLDHEDLHPEVDCSTGDIQTVKPNGFKAAIKNYFERQPLALNTITRMAAMAAVFPLFAMSAQSAAKGLAVPQRALMNFRGAGPAMLIAGADILTLLIANNMVKKGASAIRHRLSEFPNKNELEQRSPTLVPALESDLPSESVIEKTARRGAQASDPKQQAVAYAARVLLESFASVIPCSMATTLMGNHFDQQPRALKGLGRALANNFGFLTALEFLADKRPGDNRARILTALLCASASGVNNGLAMGRSLNKANINAYMLSNAFAALALQVVFESLRYPIHAKAYEQAAKES